MTEWKTVRDSRAEEPAAVDTTSSETTVYERRNIRQEERQAGLGGGEAETVTEWVYEQREYTREEWNQEQTIKRALAGLELGGDAATYREALELLGVKFEEDAV